MYRVFILLILAIGGSVFSLSPSNVIVQATKISDTQVSLRWTPIDGAVKYHVYYDEKALLKDESSEPLLESGDIDKPEITITELSPKIEYVFIVHGYDANGKDIGKSLPLHAETFQAIKFILSADPFAPSAKQVQLVFSQPIDSKKSEISLVQSDTKKAQALTIDLSHDDLRSVLLNLKQPLQVGQGYDVVLKKIVSTSGLEMKAEEKTTLKVVFGGDVVQLPATSPVPPTPPIPSVVEKKYTAPVHIDKLPQTGPSDMLIFVLFSLGIGAIVMLKMKNREQN